VNEFENAREWLDEHGWKKGSGGDDRGVGAGCVQDALYYGNNRTVLMSAYRRVAEIADELFPGRIAHGVAFPHTWNDHPDTTEEDVRLVLKHLAAEQ